MHQMLKQAFGEDVLDHNQTNNWFQYFKDGKTWVYHGPYSGEPPMPENVAALKNMAWMTSHRPGHVQYCGAAYGTCQSIFLTN